MKNRIKKRGFSLVEIIVAVMIIGFISAIIAVKIGGTVDTARQKTKEANARVMNDMMDEVQSLGGTGAVAADNQAKINITNIETLIGSLTQEPPLEVEGITFQISPKPNAKSYQLANLNGKTQVVAVKGAEAP